MPSSRVFQTHSHTLTHTHTHSHTLTHTHTLTGPSPPCSSIAPIGEIDWKVVVIPSDNPKADAINGTADAEEAYPGEVAEILEWLKFYKTVKNVNGTLEPSGDPPMEFGYDEACVDGEILSTVLGSRASLYQALLSGERENTEGMALE